MFSILNVLTFTHSTPLPSFPSPPPSFPPGLQKKSMRTLKIFSPAFHATSFTRSTFYPASSSPPLSSVRPYHAACSAHPRWWHVVPFRLVGNHNAVRGGWVFLPFPSPSFLLLGVPTGSFAWRPAPTGRRCRRRDAQAAGCDDPTDGLAAACRDAWSTTRSVSCFSLAPYCCCVWA